MKKTLLITTVSTLFLCVLCFFCFGLIAAIYRINCNIHISTRKTSPDYKYDAVIYQTTCPGSTQGTYEKVSIVNYNANVSLDSNVYESYHNPIPTDIEWKDPRTLDIQLTFISKEEYGSKKEHNVNGIVITYSNPNGVPIPMY